MLRSLLAVYARGPVRPALLVFALALLLNGAVAAAAQTPAPYNYQICPLVITSYSDTPPVYKYKILHTYPHDPTAYTEGLFYEGGYLYEGTGLHGRSEIRREDLTSGQVLQRRALASQYFGEGIAPNGSDLAELTWQSHVGFVYDRSTFEPAGQGFSYPTEGWGLTNDGTHFIMSDGTPVLHFMDPNTFAETGQITVTDAGRAVQQLNELEYINGSIYANVWMTDRIAIISPATGHVTAWIDLTGLRDLQGQTNADAVLNGIAYDSAMNRLFVTGKLWPNLYEIQLVPQ